MSDIVICIEELSKQYRLGVISTGTFYGDMKRWWAKKLRKKDPYSRIGENDTDYQDGDIIWALRNVNFSVRQGEALGIIGKNGAGKSTLLKVLSRVTAPTSGVARIRGRIASLLEVGTGFHPELTGRENIHLNGSIMGMNRREVKRKFDEIVDFSGVEKFIDTPVKRYSSGMYVRLAFSVAAHLEPEILIVDEVLAVGDIEFQKKCLGKMGKVAQEGRTVLFVSHNLAAIEALCSQAMIISGGRNSVPGETSEIVSKYLDKIATSANLPIGDRADRTGRGNVRVTSIRFDGGSFKSQNIYTIGDDISVFITIENLYDEDVSIRVSLSVNTAYESLISCDSNLKGMKFNISANSSSSLRCRLYSPPLNIGTYDVNLAIFHGEEAEDWILSAAKFSVEAGTFDDRVTTNFFPVLSKFDWDVM